MDPRISISTPPPGPYLLLRPAQETLNYLSPSPLKLPTFCAFIWLQFLLQTAWLSDTRSSWAPAASLPAAEPACFSYSLPSWGKGQVVQPLVTLTCLPLTSVSAPRGAVRLKRRWSWGGWKEWVVPGDLQALLISSPSPPPRFFNSFSLSLCLSLPTFFPHSYPKWPPGSFLCVCVGVGVGGLNSF